MQAQETVDILQGLHEVAVFRGWMYWHLPQTKIKKYKYESKKTHWYCYAVHLMVQTSCEEIMNHNTEQRSSG